MISDFAAEETGTQMFPTGPSSMASLESSLDSYKLYSALDRVRLTLIEEATDDGNVMGTILVTYYEFFRICVQVSYLGLNQSLLDTVAAIKQDVGSIRCDAISKNEMQQPILQDHQACIQHLQQLVPITGFEGTQLDETQPGALDHSTSPASLDDNGHIASKNNSRRRSGVRTRIRGSNLRANTRENRHSRIEKLKLTVRNKLQQDSFQIFKRHLDELVFPELLRSLSLLVFEDFKDLVMAVAKRAGLSEYAVSVAKVKGVDRMRVKRLTYEEDPSLDKYPPSSYVTDSLRCSFICPQSPSRSMSMAWDEISKEPRLTVLRLKNKAVTGAFPYNLHINASFQPQCCPYKIVTEIQVQHEHIYEMKEVNHRMYEIIRAPNAEKI